MTDLPMLEFASSSNDDRWFLGQDCDTHIAYVVHRANQPSGGANTRLAIGDFLRADAGAPERQALLRLLGDVVQTTSQEAGNGQSVGLDHLRAATENEVGKALEGSKVALPLTTPYEALEFFNCMIDVLTDQRASDEADDDARIAAGFGSTH